MRAVQQKRKNLMLLAMVLIVSFFALIGGYRLLNNSSADAPGLGKLLSSGSSLGIDIKLTDKKQYPADPNTQLQRVSLGLNIINKSGQVLQISPGLQMQLIDDLGNSHPMTAKYNAPGQVIGGAVAVGQSWSDYVDFDLPLGRTASKLIYQPESASWPVEVGL